MRPGRAGRAAARAVALHVALAALGGCVNLPGATDPRDDALGPLPLLTRPTPASFAPAFRRALPYAVGVYGIDNDERRSDDPSVDEGAGVSARIGSGFAVDAEGHVVTAAHVVGGAREVIVRLADRRVVTATLVGDDAETDIALLKLPAPLPGAPPLGSTAGLRLGDWVLGIGEPYGLNRSVAAGIVGGKDRHFADDHDLVFLQTDIALNPGNSGGPLLDASGAIIGMNLRTVVGQAGTPGLSLSVPIEIVRQIAAELRAGGPIRRPRLGATFDDLTPPGALSRGRALADGALVSQVRPGSAAQRLGLLAGDIVVGMNGRAVGGSADLTRALLAWRDERGTRMTVFRDGGYRELRLD